MDRWKDATICAFQLDDTRSLRRGSRRLEKAMPTRGGCACWTLPSLSICFMSLAIFSHDSNYSPCIVSTSAIVRGLQRPWLSDVTGCGLFLDGFSCVACCATAGDGSRADMMTQRQRASIYPIWVQGRSRQYIACLLMTE
jgi:hypothetical protein